MFTSRFRTMTNTNNIKLIICTDNWLNDSDYTRRDVRKESDTVASDEVH